jgi:hypothetical protein
LSVGNLTSAYCGSRVSGDGNNDTNWDFLDGNSISDCVNFDCQSGDGDAFISLKR